MANNSGGQGEGPGRAAGMLISPEYAEMNRQLHAESAVYGIAAARDAAGVVKFARKFGCASILDFGCGKGSLRPAVLEIAPEMTVLEFDPAIAGKDALPAAPVDCVAGMDVMEHIEPDYLEAVLETIHGLASKLVILKIALIPAQKTLPDGRNAHILLMPSVWWAERLERHFRPVMAQELIGEGTGKPAHFMYIGTPL